MEHIFHKIKKHGMVGSFKVAANLVNEVPDKLKIAVARSRSYNGLLIKEVQGNQMILDLNDVGISHELLLTGIHEAESTKQFRQEIKPGMHILEVGANIGYYALIGSQLIGDNGRITAFEPSPRNMNLLKANISLNSLDEIITTYPFGAGSKSGKERFYIMSKGNMSSFISRDEDRIIKTLDYIDVEMVRLDDFLSEHNMSVDYVRMDVEGYELEIIKGMERVLTSKEAPQGLFIEIHSDLLNKIAGSSCETFVNLLLEMNYDIKKARYRGKEETSVTSSSELLSHKLREKGYWEAFFVKNRATV